MGNQNTVSAFVFTDKAPEIAFYKLAYFFVQGNVLAVVLGKDGKLTLEIPPRSVIKITY